MSLDFKIDLTSLVSSIARAIQDSIRSVDVGSIWVNVFIEYLSGPVSLSDYCQQDIAGSGFHEGVVFCARFHFSEIFTITVY